MDLVIEATAEYLARQVEAGADALMLFDSWAEGLPDNIFREVLIAPTKKLVARLREMGITVPDIGFPRGAGVMLPEYVRETGVTAVGLDTAVSPAFINSELPAGFPVQGHLDPLLLI
jgi:uroporphyrinogen decarboxylase